MRHSKLSRMALALCATLSLAAVSVRAQEAKPQEHRYYDSAHKDYHTWNGDEDKHYRAYLDEQHRQYKDFSQLSKKKQRAYWQWRHDHEDRH